MTGAGVLVPADQAGQGGAPLPGPEAAFPHRQPRALQPRHVPAGGGRGDGGLGRGRGAVLPTCLALLGQVNMPI